MKKIFKSSDTFQVDLLRSFLEDNGIAVYQVSNQDSIIFSGVRDGFKELFVDDQQFESAQKIIDQFFVEETQNQ